MTMTDMTETLDDVGAPVTGKEAVSQLREAGAFDYLFAEIEAGQIQKDGPNGPPPRAGEA